MSRRFLTPVNLLHVATDPVVATEGDIYYNTTSDKIRVYIGDSWSDVGGSSIEVSDTAPESPQLGSAWYKNDTGEFYIWDGSFWVEINGVIENPPLSQEEVQDYVAPLFTHSNHVNITASYDDENNEVILTGSSEVSGDLTNIDSITYPDYIVFDTTPETSSEEIGTLSWDSDFETLKLQTNNVTLQIGQEHVIRVKNASGSVAIPDMSVVMFSGSTGDTITVSPAISTASYEPEMLVGITTDEIDADGFGFVTQFGFVNKVGTSDWELGDLLYSDPANPGQLTNVKPSAPNWTFPIAAVTRVHANTGRILVRAIPGQHLHDLVDVAITSELEDQVLRYDSESGVWKNTHPNVVTAKNATESTIPAFTPVYINTQEFDQDNITFAPADAATSMYLAKLPADAITVETVSSNSFTKLVTVGIVTGVDLTGYSLGDLLYVGVGGGLTSTRPTGTNAIQPFARVLSTDNGTIYVYGNTFASSIQTLPNLETDKIWLGTSGRPVETTLDTSVVTEGTNLYFTDERAQDATASMISDGAHNGISVEYVDASGIFNFTNTGVTSLYGTPDEIEVSALSGDITISIPDSPIFVTPDIGVATATSINGTTIPTSETLLISGDLDGYLTEIDAASTYSLNTHNHTLDSLSNVVIDTVTDGQAIVWDTATSKWINGDVAVDLSAYALLESPTFTGTVNSTNLNVSGDLKPKIIRPRYTNDGTESSDYIATNGTVSNSTLTIYSGLGGAQILTLTDILINSQNGGEYLGSVSSNNQIATIGDLSLYLPLSGGTLTGALTLPSDPTTAFQAATKQYVDEIAQGLNVKPSVHAATTENLSANYNNGIDGVGATLTSTTNGEWVGEDGVLTGWDVFNSILVKDQTNAEENGRYYISDYGSSTTPWVLTRCIYCDTSDEIPGSYIFVTDGDTYAGTGWVAVIDTPATFEIGTDDINYTQFSGTGTIIAGTNIEVDGNEISVVDAPTFTGILSAATLNLTNALSYQYGGTGITTLGTAGQSLVVNSTEDGLEWADGGSGAATVISATPPSSPEEGMTWFDNETGKLFIYDGTFWVEASNNLNDEAVMDIIANMIGDGTHNNIEITYSDLSNSLSFNVLSEPITDFLTLNESITGTPTGDAGIIVNRGDLSDVAIRFNETEDQWEYTNDGTEYQAIGSGGGAVSTSTALSNSFWLGA